jgi:lauroyl/myristoyl acyltransferase
MQFGKAAAHLHLPYYKQQYKDKETNLEVAFPSDQYKEARKATHGIQFRKQHQIKVKQTKINAR